ncbi:unnamed protein product [Malus baccata var. baccata]
MVKKESNGASGSQPSAIWNAHNTSLFCDVCIKEVEAGNRPGTHFKKEGWENVSINLNKETGAEYSKQQLKNKWDALKEQWKLWKELKGKENGLRWNPKLNTVDASDEWWHNKIQINKKYKSLRRKGISPDMEDKLDRMFMNTTATGDHAWAPSSGVLPCENNDESDEDDGIKLTKYLGKKKKRTQQFDTQVKKENKEKGVAAKKGKLGGAAKFRNTTTSNMAKGLQNSSIAEVMKIVSSLPDLFQDMDILQDEEEFNQTVCLCVRQGEGNRSAQERFQHSSETVSRYFSQLLDIVCLMAVDVIKLLDPEFNGVSAKILSDSRYMPHIKNCIGAIDGVHVQATIPPGDQVPYIGRKGTPTQNVMAACNFDMQFIFACAGWEGIAHDTRIFLSVLRNGALNFLKPPNGKYYLVDAGYPQMSSYLGPYKGERYHIPNFCRGKKPIGSREVFNHRHSSLRSVIEPTFGVWKKRWNILRDMPSYSFKKQIKIIIATITLHNYIRRHDDLDDDTDSDEEQEEYHITEEPGAQEEQEGMPDVIIIYGRLAIELEHILF